MSLPAGEEADGTEADIEPLLQKIKYGRDYFYKNIASKVIEPLEPLSIPSLVVPNPFAEETRLVFDIEGSQLFP
jgi:hypothetical protein